MAAKNTNLGGLRPAETIRLHSVASRPASLLPGATADNYKYAKIRATEQIRLLSVLPQAASREGIQSIEVRCQLDVYDRDGAPDYEALSYTWGANRRSAKIICNSKSIWVTENCRRALQTLSARYAAQLASFRSPGSRNLVHPEHRRNDSGVAQLPKLWIDAICINQEDYRERTGQVSIMGNIFHSAINTIVYLGELEDGASSSLYADAAREARPSLQHTIGLMEKIAGLVPRSWNSHSVEEMLQPSSLLDIVESEPKIFMAWVEFFSRRWFGRTWVLQEVILSRNVVVLLGDMALDWRAVQTFASIPEQVVRCADRFDRVAADDLLHTLQEHNFAKPAMIDTTPISWPMPWETDLGQDDRFVVENETMRQATLSVCPASKSPWSISVPAPRTLFNLLEQSAGLECLDPRDKLFALLSLFERDTPAEIAISYEKSSKQVYLDLSWFLISHGIFEVLSLAQGTMKAGLDSFPSWIINWTAHPRPRRLALSPYRIPPSQSLLRPFDVTIKTIDDALILRGRLLKDPISNTENRSSDTLSWFQDFQTETGIEGFGHRRLHPGDVPCLFQGYNIPILLRRRTNDSGWELVGECWLVFDVRENIRPGFDMDWSRTFPNVAQSAEQDIWIH